MKNAACYIDEIYKIWANYIEINRIPNGRVYSRGTMPKYGLISRKSRLVKFHRDGPAPTEQKKKKNRCQYPKMAENSTTE